MNYSKILVFLFTLYLVNPTSLHAQVSSTITSIGIDAKVIAPITLENTGSTPLNFGTIARSSTSGTVTVQTNGQRTYTGGASILSSSSFSAAPFTVTGENNASFNITLPANSTIELTRSGGTEKMPVNSFAHNMGGSPVLSVSGTAAFVVGATLTVNANQVPGEYLGSFSITVAYQ